LVVGASLSSVDGKSFEGTALKRFLLSQTLTGWNTWLTEIRNNVATIKTDVGTIQVFLENINATPISIDGNIVTIQIEIRIIKTDTGKIKITLLDMNTSG